MYRTNDFLQFYGKENHGRPTRLCVFDGGIDYWIEDGLPLTGIDFDKHGTSLEIMLGDKLTHVISYVKDIRISFSTNRINDGLDITDVRGRTTILRFEN